MIIHIVIMMIMIIIIVIMIILIGTAPSRPTPASRREGRPESLGGRKAAGTNT